MNDELMKNQKPESAERENGSDPEKPDLKKDRPFHTFFSKTQPLSIILKGVVPEFRDMAAKEIERCIEVDFEGKDSGVEYDSTAKLLNPNGSAEGEAATEFDIYFKITLPNGTKARFALFLDLEMQQEFSPGYDIVKRSVYYPSRMISKQLGSLSDRKQYNRLQKVHSIWIFAEGYSKKLRNQILTYSLRRSRGPAKRGSEKVISKLDHRIDLMDISFLFVDMTLEEEADEVISFLNACFYHKEKLWEHPEWLDPGNQELKEAADHMGNFAVFYEKLGETKGEVRGEVKKVIELVKEGLEDNLTDTVMTRYFCITMDELGRIKELLAAYPNGSPQELAEIYLKQKQKNVS